MATDTTVVVGRDGLRGTIEHPELLDDPRTMSVPIKLESGSEVWVPAHLVQRAPDGGYAIDAHLGQIDTSRAAVDEAQTASMQDGRGEARAQVDTADRASTRQLGASTEARVPVIQEQVDVGKRKVETAVVHISKSVNEEEQVVDEPLFREEVKIDRIPVNKVVDGPQQIRQEGDTTIVPLLEEVLVVEKRLMLKEELHITRVRWERHEQQRVPVRREEAHIERQDIRDSEVQDHG